MNNSEKKIRVVLIDSGINLGNSILSKYVKHKVSFYFDSNGDIKIEEEAKSKHIHGTIIATCIQNICNDIEIIDIGILNENLVSDSSMLIKALKYARKFNPHVINLSLGTTSKKYWIPLKFLINSIVKDNIAIVAAADNKGQRSYPASFKTVIGVKGRNEFNSRKIKYENRYFYTSIVTNYNDKENELEDSIYGNSIAAGYVTGHICNLIRENNFILKNYKDEIISKIREGYYEE